MKQRLTVTVDTEVVPVAKRYARARGASLSSLVEQALRELTAEEAGAPSFVEQWAGAWEGKLRPPEGDDPRYEYLARKYGPF